MSLRAPESPELDLTDEQVDAFRRDGAIKASGLFSRSWIDKLTEAVDFVLANPSALARGTADLAGKGATGDAFMWKTHEVFREFVYLSPAARVAQRLFGSATVTAFYDQIFSKPKGIGTPSPFHEDYSSFPIEGDQICAMWIALDSCTPSTSALQVVRGSHQWDRRTAPVTSSVMQRLRDSAGSTATQSARNVMTWDEQDLLSWDLVPGDAVIFHPAALHGATGTGPDRGRRAFVSRWVGDGVTFEPEHAVLPLLWEHGLAAGDPIGGPMFPRVLPHDPDAEWAAAEEPDPKRVDRFLERLRRI